MLIGFTAASLSIGLGFLICYFFLYDYLGNNSWEALGALCGSWMGGSGNMLAMTPVGKIKGTEEISTVLLYIVIALIASRADLSNMGNTFMWIIAGFLILIFHILIMLLFAKIFHLDIFTCAVASLANIGGTATAPILAGTYNSSLVPVGIIMALSGYIIGTGGGLLVAELMHLMG